MFEAIAIRKLKVTSKRQNGGASEERQSSESSSAVAGTRTYLSRWMFEVDIHLSR